VAIVPAVTSADPIGALRDPAAFPDRPTRVEVVETHMSWVFLTETRAYKLKKAVRYAFLDHRTPESRRRACEEEVRLNRRLAPTVYLGVLPVVRSGAALTVGGEGDPVDWVVHMRRLAADRMLDRKILDGTLRTREERGAAALLARFYRSSPIIEVDPRAHRRGIERELLVTRHELADPGAGLRAADVDEAVDAALAVLGSTPELLEGRVAPGRVVECHGDLRPEHVALGPVPAVIDCLEFDRPLRLLDPADELAFLALECERLGAPWVGEAFLAEYRRLTGDEPPERLMHVYAVVRALVRAKLAVWHARDTVDDAARWTARAGDYVALARSHARALA
jgi:aminoglycoside phosphotransferase family enzyme